MMQPIDDQSLKKALMEQGTQVWICSFGGCGTNMMLDHLETYGFKVRSDIYNERACHFSHPISIPTAKAIYMYSDPVSAIVSQHFRNVLSLNLQKASNYKLVLPKYSNTFSNLNVGPFFSQFKSWTSSTKIGEMSILHLRYERIWDNWDKVQLFLNSDFPPPLKKSRNVYTLDKGRNYNILKATRELVGEIKLFEDKINFNLNKNQDGF